MSQHISCQVSQLFAPLVRDCTPTSANHEVSVLYAPFLCDPEASKRFALVLSDGERQKADRFLTKDSKTHFIQRRAFRRYCAAVAFGAPPPLSQIAFEETDKGRPYCPDLPGIWFSFSSCRSGFLGAWSSRYKIGIDIEDRVKSSEVTELAQHFFSEAEASSVMSVDGKARLQTFVQLWCLKEAALKSIGEGLPFGLDAFEFELNPNPRLVQAPHHQDGSERFDAHFVEGTGSCAALVIRQ